MFRYRCLRLLFLLPLLFIGASHVRAITVLFKWANGGRVPQKIRINYLGGGLPYELDLSERDTSASIEMGLHSLLDIGTVDLVWRGLSQSYRILRTRMPSRESEGPYTIFLDSISTC